MPLQGTTFVLLTKTEYLNLLDSQRTLQALEAGGVDNWEWYSDSINMYYPEKYGDKE